MTSRLPNRRTFHSVTPNYLASVSDLMCGLLFVFIITLAVAVLQARSARLSAEEQTEIARQETLKLNETQARYEAQLREAATARAQALEARELADQQTAALRNVQAKLTTLEARLIGNDRSRRGLLESIRENLEKNHDILVNIDAARGVLRIPESAVTFDVGSAALNAQNAQKVSIIGAVLSEELLCFTREHLSGNPEACRIRNPNGNTLDAVFVEGHTDNQAFRGDTTGSRNRALSTGRSNTVFQTLMQSHPELTRLKNENDEVFFSLSGYGSERPVPGHFHEKPTDDSANRRIELRFIFSEPRMSSEERRLTHEALPAGNWEIIVPDEAAAESNANPAGKEESSK